MLRGARTVAGDLVDVGLDPAAGVIVSVSPAVVGPAAPAPSGVVAAAATVTGHDLTGYLLLPAPVDPHAHLDKAMLGERQANVTGDLAGAIDAMVALLPTITHEDVVARARAAALTALANGTTAIRTHADVGRSVGLRHVEALIEVRESLRHLMTIQVVALTAAPMTGPAGAANTDLLRAALAAGADVAGGCPHLDPDPAGCLRLCLAAAEHAGVPVDLHTDENTRSDSHGLADLAAAVTATGFHRGVVAGHCVSLGIQPLPDAVRTARAVAAAGVAVVTLPQTNLFLQGRDRPVATPRGLTALRALLDAGVTVAAGGDNVRDPFNPMGRGDALETASLLVVAGHLLPQEAFAAVSSAARAAVGLSPVTLAPGSPADLLAIRADGLTEAIAVAPPDRMVFSRGRLVVTTRTERTFHLGDPSGTR